MVISGARSLPSLKLNIHRPALSLPPNLANIARSMSVCSSGIGTPFGKLINAEGKKLFLISLMAKFAISTSSSMYAVPPKYSGSG